MNARPEGPTAPGIVAALLLLTRLPVPNRWAHVDVARGLAWYPLVGALVGSLTGVVGLAASHVVPPLLAASVAVIAGLLVTGAIHEDGIADVADALGGHRERDDALRILRDPRIGTYGALALGATLLVRAACLASIDPARWLHNLVVAHTLGRASILPLIRWLPPARTDGLGNAIRKGASRTTLTAGLLTAACITVPFAGLRAPVVWLTTVTVVIASVRWYRRRLGGYTGDCLGATCVATELLTLLAAAPAWPT